ncbi:hypothetical protein NOS3756_43750 [Nostoc sp. NIES-3756]|uniref:hypothetical protein n=1 Tax=Nostoc sp. NIES-3756 TaxID=1751286 RepID=UPI000720CD44|nr:hypothetical protein [Nostoc sp. NIES-3756]BAT55388.1 hypothetical protein NOS3756_43750 [Nostoc sp. NIES-3756]
MDRNLPSLRIGLIENCYHSLKRGYELWGEGQRKQDGWLLKEAVIWIHYGIELGIKQLLVQTNEYLIFDNIDIAVEKLAKLRNQPQQFEVSVLDLFEQDKPAFSVGFEKAVDRAAMMLNISELSETSTLRSNIDELTKYRNKIVHYAVTLEVNEVITLISSIMNDFIDLLERNIQDNNFQEKYLPEIRQANLPIYVRVQSLIQESESRLKNLIMNFNNQYVPGKLFGVEEQIFLPQALNISTHDYKNKEPWDIRASMSNNEEWLVEIKISSMNSSSIKMAINQLLNHNFFLLDKYESITESKIKLWFITLNDRDKSRFLRNTDFFKQNGIFVSSKDEIEELEKLLCHNE